MALPKNNHNNQSRIDAGVAEIIDYITAQIEDYNDPNRKHIRTDDLLATLSSGRHSYDRPNIKVFPNDIILAALPQVRDAGYFIWHHCDYSDIHSYWITGTPNRPHSWYHQMFVK